MQLVLERRAERSIVMALASPLIAVALTLATGAALFALLGKPPVEALKIYFLDPLRDPWALQEIAVKATPLVLWQTVQGPVGAVQAEGVNAAIRDLVGSRPTAAIADWAGLVGEEELSYDGVHPDLGHEDAMAGVVAPMLTRWWNATTADEPGCN